MQSLIADGATMIWLWISLKNWPIQYAFLNWNPNRKTYTEQLKPQTTHNQSITALLKTVFLLNTSEERRTLFCRMELKNLLTDCSAAGKFVQSSYPKAFIQSEGVHLRIALSWKRSACRQHWKNSAAMHLWTATS